METTYEATDYPSVLPQQEAQMAEAPSTTAELSSPPTNGHTEAPISNGTPELTNGHTNGFSNGHAEHPTETPAEPTQESAQVIDGPAPESTSTLPPRGALTEGPLTGKVALVTGAGRGIGAGIALELAKKGADLVINYASSSGPAQSVVASVEALGGRAIAIRADVTKPAEIEAMFEKAVAHFGHVDIVASNSGKEKFCPLAQTEEEDFDEIFNLNTRAQFFVAKSALKHISPYGRVILMSSIATNIGVAGHALYAGSKCAVEGFTRCFAADFGAKKCTVNAIAPAGVKSDMWLQNAWRYAPGCNKASSLEQIEAALAGGSPLNRCAVPADIGRVVAFLASPEGEWINGQIIPLNGGARV